MKATIIIKEGQSLYPGQKRLLYSKFETWNTVQIPAKGWDQFERTEACSKLSGQVVFVTPVPAMIKALTFDCVANHFKKSLGKTSLAAMSAVDWVWVMSNDTDDTESWYLE